MSNNHIPSQRNDRFRFTQADKAIHDEKFEVKPIGYMLDAWLRFRRNKASLVAAVIIILIVVFSLVGPLLTQYKMADSDAVYAKVHPKHEGLKKLGIATGEYKKTLNDRFLIFLNAIGMGIEDGKGTGVTWEQGVNTPMAPIRTLGELYSNAGREFRDAMVDSYFERGFHYLLLTNTEIEQIQAWEKESGKQVLYPMVDVNSQWCDPFNKENANYWYRHNAKGDPLNDKGKAMKLDAVMENGVVDNYIRDKEGNVQFAAPKGKNMFQVRVLYYNYFLYQHGFEPLHTLGTDAQGYDILIRLAFAIRLSLILSVSVSVINFTLGAIYGAIEGYYGGTVDMVMERISDILSGVPFIVVATLFQLHLVNTGKVSTLVGILFAFVLTGWLGTAYLVRTQFYRFKNQEYVLSARTLGAGDRRLMFKHIFPNTLGTIITSSVLVIPGVIFSETSLSYLGIANFHAANMTSMGTMLANGQRYLKTDPHIIFFPGLVISLLMISFNLFGNGLRDAFNPSLRGAED